LRRKVVTPGRAGKARKAEQALRRTATAQRPSCDGLDFSFALLYQWRGPLQLAAHGPEEFSQLFDKARSRII